MGKFAETDSPTRVSGQVSTYVRLTPDYSVELFILDSQAHQRWTHWIPKALRLSGQRGYSVTCPGPQICPVCMSNQKIKNAHGSNYRKHKNYVNTSRRFLTNVFDVTAVRKCDCGAVYFPQDDEYPEICGDAGCEADLKEKELEPLKRIRVLEGSATLFENFNSFADSIVDENEQPLDLREYPIKFVTRGEKRQKTITPIPQVTSKYRRPTEEDFTLSDGTVQEPYDLIELTKPFSPDEITHLMEGGGVRDVFEAREEASLEDEEIPW